MRLDFLAFQRMAHIAHGGLRLIDRLQLEILIEHEAQRRIAQHQPRSHARLRRAFGFEKLHGQTPECVAQSFHELVARASRLRHRR